MSERQTDERSRRLTLVAETYLNTVRWLFETIQCSGFTIEQVREEVARLDAEVGKAIEVAK